MTRWSESRRALAGLVVAAAALAVAAGGGARTLGEPTAYALPGPMLFPEGMGVDRHNGSFFVGAIGGGAVLRGNVMRPAATVFSPAGADGRTAALGARPDHGRVYVGGTAGTIWVYAESTGKLVARLRTGLPKAVINDFAFLPDGTAFATDTTDPYLWRITDGGRRIEKWLSFKGTPFVYVEGLNADGIVAVDGGRTLVIDQLTTGKLFRVDVATKQVSEIMNTAGGGFALTNADGMDVRGHTLYVARNANAQIATVRLSTDARTGTLTSTMRNSRFLFPTAVVAWRNRLLVLNAQLDKLGTKSPPKLPFTVVAVPRPA
jgi:Cu-Zn family superoxide dismutase